MSDTIYVTRSGTYFKGKKYAAGENIPTNRWGGPSVVSGGSSTPIQSSPAQVNSQESITENKPEFVNPDLPSSSSVIDSSKSREETIKLNKAFIKEKKFNQPLNPSETLAPVPRVEQSAMTFGVDTRGRVESNVPQTKEEKRNQEFSQARQEFKDNLLTQDNYQPPDAFKNVQTAGKVVILGSASFGVGVVKGGVGAVKDVLTGQIITKTGESLTELASNPKSVLQTAKVQFQQNPTGFIGEQVGYAGTLNKVPGVAKKVYSGSKNYINRYEIGGSKYDPLIDTPSTGKPFYPGDLDAVPNVQTTLTGERVNPDLLPKKIPDTPLRDTSLYAGEEAAKRFKIELESGKVVKETPIFDDATFIPESRITGASFVEVKYPELNVRVPVDKVFEGRYVGERTISEFLPRSEKVPTIYPEFNPTSKPLFDVKPRKGNVVDANYIEVKGTPLIKDNSVQKELNFEEGTDKFIGANIGLFTESQQIFSSIKAEFNVRPRGEVYESSTLGKVPKSRPVPVADLSKREYVSSGNKVFSNNNFSAGSVQSAKPVSESVVLQDVKPMQENLYRVRQKDKVTPVSDSVLLQKPKQDQAVAFKLAQKQEAAQVYSPITKQVTRKKSLLQYKSSKGKSVRVPKFKLNPKKGRVASFVAEVKKKGKFVSVGVFESSESAFGKARSVVSNTASASLRVRKVGGGVVSPRGFLGKQFRLSKNDGGILVERRSQRIKSAGEKQEITYKGIMVSKNKKLFGGRL